MKNLSYIILIILLSSTIILSQNEDKRFNHIRLTVTAGFNESAGYIEDHWKPETPLSVQIALPYFAGYIGAGIDYNKYEPVGKLPEFISLETYLSYGVYYNITEQLEVMGKFRLGLNTFNFDEEEGIISDGDPLKTESELFIGFAPVISYKLTHNFAITANYTFDYLYTVKKVTIKRVNAGLIYSFDTPTWIRNILE